MKRVIVTGSKGGTGRSIVKVLRSAGYDVLGIDVKPAEPDDVGYVQADLATDPGLHDLFTGAEGVAHFGSLPSDSDTSRSTAFHNLMLGGFNVFQTCANLGIKRIADASSIMVYGNFLDRRDLVLPVDEHLPSYAIDIYSSCKVMLEQLASDMCRWHGLSIAAFRLSRIVYEGCFEWRLKRHTESDASAASGLWAYVDARDVARACQLWLETDLQGFHAFNIAADDVCVDRLTRDLLKAFYPHAREFREDFAGQKAPFSSAALKKSLGWSAQYNWRDLRDGK